MRVVVMLFAALRGASLNPERLKHVKRLAGRHTPADDAAVVEERQLGHPACL